MYQHGSTLQAVTAQTPSYTLRHATLYLITAHSYDFSASAFTYTYR